MTQPLNELEKKVLAILLIAPDYRLQTCKIKKALSETARADDYSVGSLPVVLNRALQHLIIDFKLVKKDDQGHKRVFYFIPKNKKQQVETTLLLESRKQEVVNILELATAEELNEITRFLRSMPLLYNVAEKDDPSFLYWNKDTLSKKIDKISKVFLKFKTRNKIVKLKAVLVPQQVIEIGNKISNDKTVSELELIEFMFYPIDSNEARTTLDDLMASNENGKTNYQALFEFDSKVAELLAGRCRELLGPEACHKLVII